MFINCLNEINFPYLKKIYRLQNIVRYNTWQKINSESVAEHSFFVVLFAHKICDYYKVNDNIKLACLEMCTIHDAPEIVINDITYDAKCAMPEITKILEKYENKFFEEEFPEIIEKYNKLNDIDKELVDTILKIADSLSAVQYCDNEVALGNTQFSDILAEATGRYYRYKNKLEIILKEKMEEII